MNYTEAVCVCVCAEKTEDKSKGRRWGGIQPLCEWWSLRNVHLVKQRESSPVGEHGDPSKKGKTRREKGFQSFTKQRIGEITTQVSSCNMDDFTCRPAPGLRFDVFCASLNCVSVFFLFPRAPRSPENSFWVLLFGHSTVEPTPVKRWNFGGFLKTVFPPSGALSVLPK